MGGSLDTTFDATPLVVSPIIPVPFPAPVIPPPGNIWPAATYLVVARDGQLRQSAQSPEISKCISKAIRLANSNIFFINAFPNLQVQNEWLGQSLITVLQDQARTDLVIRCRGGVCSVCAAQS